MKRNNFIVQGFILLDLMLALAIFAVLLKLLTPQIATAIKNAQSKQCLANRTIIEDAARRYMYEKEILNPSIADLVTNNYLDRYPKCSANGVYVWTSTASAENPTRDIACSYHSFNAVETPLTSLGSTFSEISLGMIALIQKYFDENGYWPRSWGYYAYTDIGLDPAEWQLPYDGIIYTPRGSRIQIEPYEGYVFMVTDMKGKLRTLTSDLNWNLIYDMASGKWYYHTVAKANEIDISTLVVSEI